MNVYLLSCTESQAWLVGSLLRMTYIVHMTYPNENTTHNYGIFGCNSCKYEYIRSFTYLQ